MCSIDGGGWDEERKVEVCSAWGPEKVLAMDLGNREDSLLWGVTWCVPCAHSQSESLCLGLLTVSSGLSRLTAR